MKDAGLSHVQVLIASFGATPKLTTARARFHACAPRDHDEVDVTGCLYEDEPSNKKTLSISRESLVHTRKIPREWCSVYRSPSDEYYKQD